MFYVYLLLSEKDNKRYIGCTENLVRRLAEHNSGQVKSTKSRRPLRLIYSEKFNDKSGAMKREKEIKAKKGKFNIPRPPKYSFRGGSDRLYQHTVIIKQISQ